MTFNCQYDVAFKGYQLNRPPFVVDNLRTYSAPPSLVSRLRRVTRPGSLVSRQQFDEKVVEITGRIVAAGRNRETLIMHTDIMKRSLENGRGNLLVGYPDARYYQQAQIVDEIKINWLEESSQVVNWTAQFLCSDPLLLSAIDVTQLDTQLMASVGGTEFVKTLTLEPGGSAFTYPVLEITVQTSSFLPTKIWVINVTVTPNQALFVTYPFAFGDVLTIDGPEMSVRVNGIEVDYSGQFPVLDRRAGRTNDIEIHCFSVEAP